MNATQSSFNSNPKQLLYSSSHRESRPTAPSNFDPYIAYSHERNTSLQRLPSRASKAQTLEPIKDRQAKSWSRVTVSRNLQQRKDRKNLRRVQDTLRQIDHI